MVNQKFNKIVPDTSVIIEGLLSESVKNNSLKFETLIIPEAVLAELENQANKGKDSGFKGLDEIIKLRSLKGFNIEYAGSRPGDFEIKFAKSGEIDSLIREIAFKEKATLLTADIVQAKVAKAKGVNIYFYRAKKSNLLLEQFLKYDKVIIKEDEKVSIILKGRKRILKKVFDKFDIKELSRNLMDYSYNKDGFVVVDNKKGFLLIKGVTHNFCFLSKPVQNKSELIINKKDCRNFKEYDLDKSLFNDDAILIGKNRNEFLDVLVSEFKELDVKYVNSFNLTHLEMLSPDRVICFDIDSFDELRKRGFIVWCLLPFVKTVDFLDEFEVNDVNVLEVNKEVKVVRK